VITLVVQVIVVGVVVGCFYSLIATGLQITYAATRVLNFAQGDFAVAGMLGMWSLSVGLHWNLWLCLPVLIGAGVALGMVFELIVVRPVIDASPLLAAIATFAGGIILRSIYLLQYGALAWAVPPFISGSALNVGSIFVSRQSLIVIAGAVIAFVAISLLLQSTWIGRAMRATAENREGVAVSGVNPRVISSLAFGINGGLSVLAGALMAPIFGARFDFGLNFAVTAFVAGALGGLSNTAGAAVGGLILGLAVSLIAAAFGSEFNYTWLLIIMAAVLYLRPNGLLGRLIKE
jgi:branched-chain amino acid transport system permease protein